jgi:hypothetical protein
MWLDGMVKQALAALLPAVLLLLAVGAIKGWFWWDKVVQGRTPVEDRLLRPPGYSLQEELTAKGEQLAWSFAGLAVFGVASSGMVGGDNWLRLSTDLTYRWTIFSACALGLSAFGIRIVAQVRRIRSLTLRVRGERAVGEELNRLSHRGCFIFHDLPAGGNDNIDHVVVAPSGVYAIETKTHRKPRRTKNGPAPQVFFDGSQLKFPDHIDTRPLWHIRRSAAWLGRFLSNGTGTSVNVLPVLTLPGWFVQGRSSESIKVLNPKQITSLICGRPAVLSTPQIKRICHHLDEACRTVEF